MKITYNTGAKVILQGPCTFEVDSAAGGFLSLGKLTARVEQSTKYGVRSTERVASDGMQNANCKLQNANCPSPNTEIPKSQNPSLTTNHYPLFTIKTPTAVVTDLGTEFGVEVNNEGETTSHVFRGSVRVQRLSERGNSIGDGQVLRENETAWVERRGTETTLHSFTSSHPGSFTPSYFVRELPRLVVSENVKLFDLADVVAGGDGYSGRRDAGIDVAGHFVSQLQENYRSVEDYPVGDHQYHPVEGSAFVDGVFVPDGSRGPVQIDSVGRTYADFRPTDNFSPGVIWAAGPAIAESQFPEKAMLGGVNYAVDGHAALLLPSNKGITFDLQAVRRANPGWRIVRFHAVVTNNEPVSEKGETVFADMVILVDGKERFKRREINAYNSVFHVNIPIDDNSRFLTLATTDGGNSVYWDWVVYGDPKLELVPKRLEAVGRQAETEQREGEHGQEN